MQESDAKERVTVKKKA